MEKLDSLNIFERFFVDEYMNEFNEFDEPDDVIYAINNFIKENNYLRSVK